MCLVTKFVDEELLVTMFVSEEGHSSGTKVLVLNH